MVHAEFLVILERERAPQTLDLIRARHRVAQTATPRVVVVEGSSPDTEARLRAIPGVRAVTAGDLASANLEGLDQAEALFARAWMSRMTESQPKKRRRGDGAAWDAPGVDSRHRPTFKSGESSD
jgi:hypothetical protein